MNFKLYNFTRWTHDGQDIFYVTCHASYAENEYSPRQLLNIQDLDQMTCKLLSCTTASLLTNSSHTKRLDCVLKVLDINAYPVIYERVCVVYQFFPPSELSSYNCRCLQIYRSPCYTVCLLLATASSLDLLSYTLGRWSCS